MNGKHGKGDGDWSSISEGSTSGSSSSDGDTYETVMIIFIVAFVAAMAGVAGTCYALGRRRKASEAQLQMLTSPGKAMEWDHTLEPDTGPNAARLATKANPDA